jgi:hypothetical protein
VTANFPPDPSTGGFDNNVSTLHVSTLATERYQDAAEQMASAVLADATRSAQVIGCDPATGDACLASFITSFGGRAWRRTLSASEVMQLTTLAHAVAAGDPTPRPTAIGGVMRAMLQSPEFLFRIERGVPDPAHPGWNRLTGFEMASRLSYLLWGTTPDEALLIAASDGQLDTAEGVQARAQTMLADPRARDSSQSFYMQWFQLDQFDESSPATSVYPRWNPRLQAAMLSETQHFVDSVLWTPGGDMLDVLTANYSFINPQLASLYGLPVPAQQGMMRMTLDPATNRGGLLTQASVLTLNADPDEGSPVKRGQWVREQLMCENIGSPPPDVPPLPPPNPMDSQRDRLDAHRLGTCAACHTLMDPIGFGLERYNGIGVYSTTDTGGHALTGVGQIVGQTNPDFTGPFELAQRLHEMPEVSQCVVKRMFRYTYGRIEAPSDACTLTQFNTAFGAGRRNYAAFLVAIAGSDAFRYVVTPAAGGGM